MIPLLVADTCQSVPGLGFDPFVHTVLLESFVVSGVR